jgi:hypothetical protein
MKLVTIPDVELVSTGTYKLGTGTTTFTADDLASAVLASTDPTLVAPRIGIGHTDPRFADVLDGEPALGVVANMRLDHNGQTIVGDLENVPDWLAEAMPAMYPGRSIEGGLGFQAPSGRDYKLVISSLKLLGQTWPGVTSLDDLKQLAEKNGEMPEAVAASGGFDLAGGTAEQFIAAAMGGKGSAEGGGIGQGKQRTDMAKIDTEQQLRDRITRAQAGTGGDASKAACIEAAKRLGLMRLIPPDWDADQLLTASIDVGALPRTFAIDLEAGKVPQLGGTGPQAKWWPRNVEADGDRLSFVIDDEDGHLIRLPITLANDAVAYGTPTFVETPSTVAASDGQGSRVLASWASKAARPRVEARMKIEQEFDTDRLRKRLGLADDADEAKIIEALTADLPASPPATTAASGQMPEGTVLIDAAKLTELEDGAKAGAEVRASLAGHERDDAITGAVEGGRIAASRREHFQQRWDVDPDGTRTLLTADVKDGGLAAVIPVQAREMGRSGDGEGDTTTADAEWDSAMAQHFPELADPAKTGA